MIRLEHKFLEKILFPTVMQVYVFVQNEESRRKVMLNTISQEKAALAIIPDHLAEKKGSDDTEKDKGNCIIVLR